MDRYTAEGCEKAHNYLVERRRMASDMQLRDHISLDRTRLSCKQSECLTDSLGSPTVFHGDYVCCRSKILHT